MMVMRGCGLLQTTHHTDDTDMRNDARTITIGPAIKRTLFMTASSVSARNKGALFRGWPLKSARVPSLKFRTLYTPHEILVLVTEMFDPHSFRWLILSP